MNLWSGFEIFASIMLLIQIFFSIVPYLYQQFIKPLLNGTNIDFKKYGKWAVVTGGSDGIGKQYARHLAKRGLNIILIALPKGLNETADEIKNEFGVEISTIGVDFTKGFEIYEKIRNAIKGKEIGVLVNNVGMANAEWALFLDYPNLENHIHDLINCNLLSVPMMCSIILPQMVERKKGLIINLSSISAIIPMPCMALYAGTKAFIYKFCLDLEMEYKDKGIIVQTIMPGPVATTFTRRDNGTIFVPKSDVFVNSAFKTLGNTTWTFGYWFHHVQYVYIKILNFFTPSYLNYFLTTRNIKDGERKRQIRLAKEAKLK